MKRNIILTCFIIFIFSTVILFLSYPLEVKGVSYEICLYENDDLRYKSINGDREYYRDNYSGKIKYRYSSGNDSEYTDEYFYWEFTNTNIFTISLDIELWRGEEIISTESVILPPKQKYDFKTFHPHTRVNYYNFENHPIHGYHVKYKAYKATFTNILN